VELKLVDLGQTDDILIICASMGFIVPLMLYVVQATFQRLGNRAPRGRLVLEGQAPAKPEVQTGTA